jgi:hypothetical protein
MDLDDVHLYMMEKRSNRSSLKRGRKRAEKEEGKKNGHHPSRCAKRRTGCYLPFKWVPKWNVPA